MPTFVPKFCSFFLFLFFTSITTTATTITAADGERAIVYPGKQIQIGIQCELSLLRRKYRKFSCSSLEIYLRYSTGKPFDDKFIVFQTNNPQFTSKTLTITIPMCPFGIYNLTMRCKDELNRIDETVDLILDLLVTCIDLVSESDSIWTFHLCPTTDLSLVNNFQLGSLFYDTNEQEWKVVYEKEPIFYSINEQKRTLTVYPDNKFCFYSPGQIRWQLYYNNQQSNEFDIFYLLFDFMPEENFLKVYRYSSMILSVSSSVMYRAEFNYLRIFMDEPLEEGGEFEFELFSGKQEQVKKDDQNLKEGWEEEEISIGESGDLKEPIPIGESRDLKEPVPIGESNDLKEPVLIESKKKQKKGSLFVPKLYHKNSQMLIFQLESFELEIVHGTIQVTRTTTRNGTKFKSKTNFYFSSK